MVSLREVRRAFGCFGSDHQGFGEGSPVVSLGLFAHALSALSRLYELDELLPPPKRNFDRLAELNKPLRKRAPRKDRKR